MHFFNDFNFNNDILVAFSISMLHYLDCSNQTKTKTTINIMTKRYNKYSNKTQDWMNNLINSLKKEVGEEIPDSYFVSLDLIADAVELYFNAINEIKVNGLICHTPKGEKVKNPAIPVINSTQLFIHKMLSSFGLTMMSASKMKKQNLPAPNELDEFLDE